MRRLVFLLTLSAAVGGCATGGYERGLDRAIARGPVDFMERAVVGPMDDGTFVVPTTQHIDPAGEQVLFPTRPVQAALSPDEKTLAVKGLKELLFVDTASRRIVQTLVIEQGHNSFHGLAWSSDGNHVWTTGSNTRFLRVSRGADGAFAWTKRIELPGPNGQGDSVPGGFVLDEAANRAYVALSRNNTIGVVDLAADRVLQEIRTGIAPYDVLRLRDTLYVANWAGRRPGPGDLKGPTSGSEMVVDAAGLGASGTVSVIDLASAQAVCEIEAGLHPSGMALSPDAKTLYVANANSDTISLIDTATNTERGRWDTRPLPELPFGSAPNALAVSPDGATIYVANAGNNSLAAIDAASGAIRGLIPTGWYPGDVVLSRDGRTLYVANTKGVGSREESPQRSLDRLAKYVNVESVPQGYSTHSHTGSLSVIAAPASRELDAYTYRTAVAMRLPRMKTLLDEASVPARAVPLPTKPGETSHFKYVFYIIKENRTYDQVFGDLPQGDGDPALCHFGRDVTPNQHALAEEFVLLDNFYCNGVLSADGHQWTNEGYVTDYIEKSFGDWPRSYPYDGDDALAFASSGFIWDHVLRAGYTFRNYGEMVQATITPAGLTWTDVYNDFTSGAGKVSIRATTKVRGLEPYLCPNFIGFPELVTDVQRAEVFLAEFREFERSGALPNFTIMLLPNDHTVGTKPGYPTPRAAVADNDLALGRIVEAISHSRFWPETAIFVVEDDPQAGLDHVDGHRTVALCVSPYTRRGVVDSTHYNQTSMLRSMELIFGLAPMNQLTMAANPMTGCFMETPDLTPYAARDNIIPLDELNPELTQTSGLQRRYAEESMRLPLDEIDRAPEDTLNRIIWHSVKGYDTPYPVLAQRRQVAHTAWPGAAASNEEEE